MKSNEVDIPADLRDALSRVPAAESAWANLTPISRRDFISWIETAKREETRAKRVLVAIDKLVKGQKRPCCYAVVPMDLYKALGENPNAKATWSKLSADEKRDFSDWVGASDSKDDRKNRVQQACTMLGDGAHAP